MATPASTEAAVTEPVVLIKSRRLLEDNSVDLVIAFFLHSADSRRQTIFALVRLLHLAKRFCHVGFYLEVGGVGVIVLLGVGGKFDGEPPYGFFETGIGELVVQLVGIGFQVVQFLGRAFGGKKKTLLK